MSNAGQDHLTGLGDCPGAWGSLGSCFKCSQEGHWVQACPNPCSKCHQEGHWSVGCSYEPCVIGTSNKDHPPPNLLGLAINDRRDPGSRLNQWHLWQGSLGRHHGIRAIHLCSPGHGYHILGPGRILRTYLSPCLPIARMKGLKRMKI